MAIAVEQYLSKACPNLTQPKLMNFSPCRLCKPNLIDGLTPLMIASAEAPNVMLRYDWGIHRRCSTQTCYVVRQ